jgi:Tol biopolymer transport system component
LPTTLSLGDRLGPFEILSALGEGGMGAVYRARDSRLNRDVAIKVLLAAVADDPERRARFEREAQVLASLNHPNIAHIHGLEDAGGITALVLELVDGPTLADRIEKGALPLDEALPIARQIAEALEAAHEQGIVHRDLKPANIKVRADGTVKVLDFGLAKAIEPAGAASGSISISPTITSPAQMTAVGVVLGTAAYMSPEQARGKAVNKRADIWAFGCVLYEMLTGRRPFDGEDITEVLGAVVRLEPAWEALPAAVPPPLRALLHGCLVKDPRQRVGDMSTALFVLDKGPSLIAAVAAPAAPARSRLARTAPWLVAAAAVIALAGVLAVVRLRQPVAADRGVSRLLMPIAPALTLNPSGVGQVAIDQGATRVAFLGRGGPGRSELFMRDFDRPEATRIDGTRGATNPALSPDGRWLAFFADGVLKTVSAGGGQAQTICNAPNGLGITWLSADVIAFGTTDALMRVSARGGTPEPLIARRDEILRWAVAIPGSSSVLFSARPLHSAGWDDATIEAASLDGSARRTVLKGGVPLQVLPAGFLIFRRSSTVFAVTFDAARIVVTGTPFPILESVSWNFEGESGIAVAADGTLVSPDDTETDDRSLVWVDGAQVTPLGVSSRAFADPRVSADGQRVAFEQYSGTDDIWAIDLRRDAVTRLSFDPGEDETPVWSPDGRWIVYAGSHTGATNTIFRRSADGGGAEESLLASDNHVHVDDWTRDGAALLLSVDVNGSQNDIAILPLGTKGAKPTSLVSSPFNERHARLSPDGRWLSYTSNESGTDEVFVRPFPSLAGKWQASTHGGRQAVWAPNGRTLYYRGEKKLMAVDIAAGATPQLGTPRPLFDDVYYSKGENHMGYDVAPDGRFLFVRANGGRASGQHLAIVEHLVTELQRRSGAK